MNYKCFLYYHIKFVLYFDFGKYLQNARTCTILIEYIKIITFLNDKINLNFFQFKEGRICFWGFLYTAKMLILYIEKFFFFLLIILASTAWLLAGIIFWFYISVYYILINFYLQTLFTWYVHYWKKLYIIIL